jgi:subtilisin family serine protease
MIDRKWMALVAVVATLGLGACATSGSRAALPANYTADARYVVVTVRNVAAQPDLVGAGPTLRGHSGRYRVSPQAEQIVEAIGLDHGLTLRNGWPIRMLGVHCVVFEVSAGRSIGKVLAELRADKRVESAQRLNQFSTASGISWSPDQDPYREWQYSLSALNVAPLHAHSQGQGVRVAVIDTGVDDRHPDIVRTVVEQQDFVGHGREHQRQEIHGTAVAGVIGATTGNRIGIAGISPGARIYALRACWPPRIGDALGICNSFTLAQALGAAADVRAQVVNLSLTGPADPLLERMLAVLLEQGVVVIMAAPADDQDRLGIKVPGVIHVRDAFASQLSDFATIPAPGTDILTLHPGGQLRFHTGSSLAAAQISGVAALILGMNRNLAPQQLADALQQASLQIRSIGKPPRLHSVRCVDACAVATVLGIAVECTDTGTQNTQSRAADLNGPR